MPAQKYQPVREHYDFSRLDFRALDSSFNFGGLRAQCLGRINAWPYHRRAAGYFENVAGIGDPGTKYRDK